MPSWYFQLFGFRTMERKSSLGNPPFSVASLQNSTNGLFVRFCFCFVIFKNQFALPKYSWICGFLLEYGLLSKVYTFRENCLPPSQQLIINSSFMARGGIMYYALSSCSDLICP